MVVIRKSVLIKTDGSNEIGMGHIILSITLAKKFKEKGYKIFFLTPKNKILQNKLSKFGIWKWFKTKNDEKEIIKKIKPDIIILNISKKFFSPSVTYIKNLKKICKLLITFENTGKIIQYVDLSFNSLIFHNYHKIKKNFQGIEFCPIRKEFLESRKNYKIRKKVKSIILLQGGADTRNVSLKLIKFLEKMNYLFKITVIIGPMSQNYRELEKFAKLSSKKITLLYDVKKMHSEIKKHDIAITAGGTTLIESLTIGIPSIIACGEMHEMALAKNIHIKKAAKNLGYGPQIKQKLFIKTIELLCDNFEIRKNLNTKAKHNVDGKGLNRIFQLIEKEMKKEVRN